MPSSENDGVFGRQAKNTVRQYTECEPQKNGSLNYILCQDLSQLIFYLKEMENRNHKYNHLTCKICVNNHMCDYVVQK